MTTQDTLTNHASGAAVPAPTTTGTAAPADPLAALRAAGITEAQIGQLMRALASNGGGKVPRECACGCKAWTKGGRYRPGHDAKHMSQVLRGLRA